ncbi:hypothetical protein GF319_00280, partial [Candidatus Bathyarchaeota archaeon]|nr:hypothetical protein [Candidatus Bathyarchaeota archaeon]
MKNPPDTVRTRSNLKKVILTGTLFIIILFITKQNPVNAYRYIDSSRIIDIENPIGSTVIKEGEIPPGEYMAYKYKLAKDHKYHIYLNGEWT